MKWQQIPEDLEAYCTVCDEFVDLYCEEHPGEWNIEWRRPNSFRHNPTGGYRPGQSRKPPRTGPTYCQAPGCKEPTREGKPYCSIHIEKSSYVQDLLNRLSGRETEEEMAREGRIEEYLEHSPSSSVVQEILTTLRMRGERTTAALAKELLMDEKAIRGYINYLVKQGKVVIRPIRRGGVSVRLSRTSGSRRRMRRMRRRLRRRRNPWMGW